MRDHELELILSVLDGTAEDPDAALAIIAASEELDSEYRAQLRARSALESLGHPVLSADESARLRRDVWTHLRQDAAPAHRNRIPWYYRWIPAAGVGMLVLVVGINVLSSGGQDAGDGAALQESATALGDSGADTTTAGATAGGADGEDSAGAEAPAAEDLTALRSVVQDLRAEILEFQSSDDGASSPDEEGSLEDLMACLEDAGAGGLALLGLLPPDDDAGPLRDRPLIAAAEPDADLTTAEITLVDASTCEVVYQGD